MFFLNFKNHAKITLSGNLCTALKGFISRCTECFKSTKEVKIRWHRHQKWAKMLKKFISQK